MHIGLTGLEIIRKQTEVLQKLLMDTHLLLRIMDNTAAAPAPRECPTTVIL